MQTHGNSHLAETRIGWAISQLRDEAKRFGARIIRFLDACADAYAAAALYNELSKLSNAEIERRGISRGDVHRHVFEALTTQ